MIRVLLVDNSPLVPVVLLRTVVQALDIKVMGTTSNGEEAMVLMPFLRPEVILTDLYMPVIDGLTFLDEVLFLYPTLNLLLVSTSAYSESPNTFEALGAILSRLPHDYGQLVVFIQHMSKGFLCGLGTVASR